MKAPENIFSTMLDIRKSIMHNTHPFAENASSQRPELISQNKI